MSLRTVMIFPEFENMYVIDPVRNRYDPLAKLVRPHITIVFPFESDMRSCPVSWTEGLRLLGRLILRCRVLRSTAGRTATIFSLT